MKSIKQIVFVALLVGCFVSCKKSDSGTTPPPPPPPTQVSKDEMTLTKTPWLVDNEGIDTNKDGVIDIQDARMSSPCNTDDTWEFTLAGVILFDEGSIKCHAGDPEIVRSAWHFVDNDSSIYIDFFNSSFKIFKLTDKQFQIYTEVPRNGSTIWNFSQFKR